MRVTATDGIVLLYNVAVVLSGWYVAAEAGIEDRLVLIAISVVLGLFWTGYFRIAMLPRLRDQLVESDEDEDETPAEPLERE